MNARILQIVLATIFMSAAAVPAAEVHVAPNGKPDGDGSAKKPFDIFTVFAENAPVEPGDTVLLHGGQYDGMEEAKNSKDGGEYTERIPFAPKLRGTQRKPIIVTSTPGEWAHLNGAVRIEGCDFTHFMRIEIGDLKWDPYQEKHRVPTAFNAVRGNQVKLINCNVFGGAMGTGLWRPALDLEAYGNLVHDFGTMKREGGRGHGHAFYIQNDQGTKTLEHNVAYRGCGWHYDIYTQQGEIKGFDILENIGYIPGWYKQGQTSFNFGLTGWKPFVYSSKEQYPEEDTFAFAEWQKLGLDANSTLLPGRDGKPVGTRVLVFPNRYERGRANVAVFNWDHKHRVEADLTGALVKRQKYAVYNCLDIRQTITRAKPVLNGVFDGQPIALPMRGREDCPDFDAFLVLPLSPAGAGSFDR